MSRIVAASIFLVSITVIGLIAIGAAPAKLTPIQEMQVDVLALKADVAKLKARIDAMAADMKAAQAAAVPVAQNDITKAIKEHQLAIGMTLAQAEQALGKPGMLESEDTISKRYAWQLFGEGPRAAADGYWKYATFENGKLVRYSN